MPRSNRIIDRFPSVPPLLLGMGVVALLTVTALAEPAFAQRDVPVTILNDESSPVPVVQAGRVPYQFRFALFNNSTSEDCDAIPVPDGMVLHLTTISVEAQIDVSDVPDVYLTVARSTGGFTLDRFGGPLSFVGSTGDIRRYRGFYNTQVLLASGPVVSYNGSICVGRPPNGFNSAEGLVSGYLEPGQLVDGNTLP